jgi:hypothetical protein
MIPRSPTPLLVACVLASVAQGHATTIDDLLDQLQAPYLEDTVFGSGSGQSQPRFEFTWEVGSRDAKGRVQTASYIDYPNPSPDSAQEYTFDYSWDQPVEIPFRSWALQYLPSCMGCRVWPSRVRTHLTTREVTFVWDEISTWNPSSRSLTVDWVGVGSTIFEDGPCPWRDSLVFDASLRPVLQVRCLDSKRNAPGVAFRTWMRLGYDNPTDTRPRWTSEGSEDTSEWIDSVRYEGPAETPTRLIKTIRKAGGSKDLGTTRVDSLIWSRDGHLQSRIYGYKGDTSRVAENYTWVSGRLKTVVLGFYPSSNLLNPTTVLNSWSFGYGLQGTAVPRSAVRIHGLRRSANGRIVLPRRGTSPVQVEWTALDGRRQDLAVVPEGEGTISVAAPRGPGFLRVTQDGRTKVHPIANF